MTKILVIGGTGNFGKCICLLLSNYPEVEVSVIEKPSQTDLKESDADIVIHATGPFHGQSYEIAQTCIETKKHYIDISDSREFVFNIKTLDEAAKAQGVVVISGASPMPGLSSAVIQKFYSKFSILREMDFGICPVNQVEILNYIGQPFTRLENGTWKTVYGWQKIHQHYYGDNLGLRWQVNGDVPDLILLPEKYPSLKTVKFYAGLELPSLHWALWSMSWLTKWRLVKNWSAYTKSICKISDWFDKYDSPMTGMYIHLSGSNLRYQPLDINWTLVAEKGHGAYIHAILPVILTRKIIEDLIEPGAQPCLGLFTLGEFDKEAARWRIYHTTEEIER